MIQFFVKSPREPRMIKFRFKSKVDQIQFFVKSTLRLLRFMWGIGPEFGKKHNFHFFVKSIFYYYLLPTQNYVQRYNCYLDVFHKSVRKVLQFNENIQYSNFCAKNVIAKLPSFYFNHGHSSVEITEIHFHTSWKQLFY